MCAVDLLKVLLISLPELYTAHPITFLFCVIYSENASLLLPGVKLLLKSCWSSTCPLTETCEFQYNAVIVHVK